MSNFPKKTFEFEVLFIDVDKNLSIQSADGMILSLASNYKVTQNPKITNTQMTDSNGLEFKVILTENGISGNIFSLKITGGFDVLESRRKFVLEHLKIQGYLNLYILNDEISADIANQIYPKIGEIENGLRRYLMSFFITKIGANWWRMTADTEMNKKASQRKNNETIFRDFIDNKIYLIDFGDLGKMVYSQSSGFIDKDAVLERILGLADEPDTESIKSLKRDLDTNYNKFFKDTFKDKGFQEKWETLEGIRHKVAHNNLFTQYDLDQAFMLCDDLSKILEGANSGIIEVDFSDDEKIQIQETIANSPLLDRTILKHITKDELLIKLDGCERWAKQSRDGFLSLKHFVVSYLGSAGYDWTITNGVIHELEAEGKIELYDYSSPTNPYPIRAIKKKV